MRLSSRIPVGVVLASAALLTCAFTAEASAQDRRGTVFGHVGFASIGHSDSEQGKAPIFGGGGTFHLTPWLLVEGDVHGGRVRHVFGREHHDFTEFTVTGSLLFRAPLAVRAHFVAGGGLGLQRAHSDFDATSGGRVDRTETIRLLHGRIGAEWDVTKRIVIRTDAVMWFGGGLDWIVGGRAGIGYRF